MSNPYPWAKEKTHQKAITITDKAKLITYPLLLTLSLTLHPAGTILSIHAYYKYIKHNHPPQQATRKLAKIGIALLTLNLITWSAPWEGTITLLNYITGTSNPGILGWARILLSGAGTSILLATPVTYIAIWNYEYKTRAYLKETTLLTQSNNTAQFKPTKEQIKKQKENEQTIKHPTSNDHLAFGTVAHDLLPWRTHRYGCIVGTPIDQFSHTIVLGSTGSGKSVFLTNLIDRLTAANRANVLLDFKGDTEMENTLAHIADLYGVPFYSFWSDLTDRGFRFDPLDQFSNIDMASVLTTALGITPQGEGAIYAETVEEFLGLQFEVMRLGAEVGGFGRRDGESVADYLYRVVDEGALKEELDKVTNTNKETREKINNIKSRLQKNQQKRNVDRLRINLSKLIGLLGPKMRPHPNPARNIRLEDAINQGAILYFGMPPGGNQIALRVLGGLLLRNFAALATERGRKAANGQPAGVPVFVEVDEVQRLGDLAELATEIPQQGRFTGVTLVTSSQTFQTLSPNFVGEMIGNVKTVVLMNTTHPETVSRFTDVNGMFGSMNVLDMMRGSETEAAGMSGESQEHTGKANTKVATGPRIEYDKVTELPPRHAFVYFPSSPDNALLESSFERVRGDMTRKDIPLVKLVSKDYLLESGKDPSALRKFVGALDVSDGGVVRDEVGEKEKATAKETTTATPSNTQQHPETENPPHQETEAFSPDDW